MQIACLRVKWIKSTKNWGGDRPPCPLGSYAPGTYGIEVTLREQTLILKVAHTLELKYDDDRLSAKLQAIKVYIVQESNPDHLQMAKLAGFFQTYNFDGF